jgi:hypothetical protein
LSGSERDLPSNGKGREIFLAALRDFSNNCEAPELTPHCPYYELTRKGAICGEQCHDLLAEHHAVERTGTVDFGEGLAMYARRGLRPRRGPDDSNRPFDAAEILLRDRDKPTDARHTVSLIKDTVDQLAMPPSLAEDPENRSYVIQASVVELVHRGFSEVAVRSALARSISPIIVVTAALPLIAKIREPKGWLDPGWSELLAEWRAIHTIAADDMSPELFLNFVHGTFGENLRNWLHSLTLPQLIDWLPPPSIRYMEEVESAALEVRQRAAWLIDRFTNTYIDNWSDSALHLEWLYLHGQTRGCAEPDQMAIRRVLASDISRIIAIRATDEWRESSSSDTRSFKESDFTMVAVEHLRVGRYDAATAIYEGLYALAPADVKITNNLAFTLVPRDPVRALELFNKAWQLSNCKNVLALANRVFALRLLDRPHDAIEVAKDLSSCDSRPEVAWLWASEGSERSLVLLSDQDPTDYINRQVAEINSGDS